MSPPRHQPTSRPTEAMDEDGDDGEIRLMAGHGRNARAELDSIEEMEHMAWIAQEDMFRGNPFASMGFPSMALPFPDLRIPLRHREAAGMRPGPSRRRDAAREVGLDGGAVPDMSGMGEEEYSEWIREGMYRLKNRDEVRRQEKIRQEKLEKERLMEKAKDRARKDEKRRIDQLKREKGKLEEDRRKAQRDRYGARWATVGETGGEIEEAELAFKDIPWPIYASRGRLDIEDLETDAVRTFLEAVAVDRGQGNDEFKKILRDAIRAFHPDRFFSRILSRVRAGDQDKVKEGVERCSRIINALAAELRSA